MNKLKKYYSTFRLTSDLQKSMMALFVKHAPILITSLYDEDSESNNESPEIRVGLAIKILHNTPVGTRFSLQVLEPVIRDIEAMIKDHDYLRSTGEPKLRMRCLRNELVLVQRYIDLDDTLSLNCGPSELTFQDSKIDQSQIEESLEKTDEIEDTEQCCLM